MSVPEGYICPISQQIMEDPYIDTDGNSYERAAIMEWLLTRQQSPITRKPLRIENLVPNRALKTIIDEYRASLPPDVVLPVPVSEPCPLDRKPIMLFAVIDNSGSMGEPCGGSGNEEDDGFSRLDLVKHTMNTIITSLTKYDKVCLIKFSSSAEVIAHVTALTDSNKTALKQVLEALIPEYSTNIWDGLRVALEIIVALPVEDITKYNVEMFLLTDGVPNINPPRPITETLETYLNKKCTALRPKVHTFGYGYNLQSNMLYELAKVGSGTFGFIPDSSMVGTVFINSLSNSLVGSDPVLKDATIDSVCYRLCTLLRQLLATADPAQQQAQLTEFISIIEAELEQHVGNKRVHDFLQALLLDCKATDDPNAGQIMKATEPAFFKKWGKHYLYSVLSAFEHQVCINFKDKAMQSFKSETFTAEQERIEEVFVQLPAPTPSARAQTNIIFSNSRSGYSTASAPAPPPPPRNMTNYHYQGGGCFSEDSVLLQVVENSTAGFCIVPVKVNEVRAGMTLWSLAGPTKVECVVQLRYQGILFQVENLILTPYHPIMHGHNHATSFPVDNNDTHNPITHDGYVYDFVLANRSIVASPLQSVHNLAHFTMPSQIQEICLFAATFGHTVMQGCFAHAYFGSERVVNDLKRHANWSSGYILLDKYAFLRANAEDAEPRVVGMLFDHKDVMHAANAVDTKDNGCSNLIY